MVGASAPLGFFDPMGFSKGPEERLNEYRESELKHGRTAMLAVVGFLTQVSRMDEFSQTQMPGIVTYWLEVGVLPETIRFTPP